VKITVLGSGTSQGVPVIGCTCPVCTSTEQKDNRLRASIWLEVQGRSIVVDSGPDFRQQMLRARVGHLTAIVFTHAHKDHVAGLDDVRAFNFKQRSHIPAYADGLTQEALRREFAYIFDGTNYPGIPQVELKSLDGLPFDIAGVPLIPIPMLHHQLRVWGIRVGDFAYLTDTNHIPPESRTLLQGLEVMILDALRHEPHIAHFTLKEALEVVRDLQPRRTYLTHISHLLGRHSEVEATLPQNVYLAYDGLTLELPDPIISEDYEGRFFIQS
jgi:phosphoribosyl 1,2-cyclic phosphate phosphodiesterase